MIETLIEKVKAALWTSMKRLGSLPFASVFSLILPLILLGSSPSFGQELAINIDSAPINRSALNPIASYAPILNRVTPAVVSVHTAEVVRIVRSVGSLSPEEDFLRRFFGLSIPRGRIQPEQQIQERKIPSGVGSGVIISSEGIILTNNHVVSDSRGKDVDEVLVQLADGRELQAEIVGRDPQTDIAVLRVEAEDLHAAAIADSENIAVGDIVFAIGNPMGVGLTVTQGIVSATRRTIGIYGEEGYESFIQTDASINPGNSGGALVDAEGRLIGINSAILSRGGGSIGLGFAIPGNLAVSVARQIVERGEVRRGYLGVKISDLSAEMAKAFDLNSINGVLVNQVEEGGAAEKAGIKRGDVIVSVGGRPVNNSNDLRTRIGPLSPGSQTEVEVMRKGRKQVFQMAVGDMDDGLGESGSVLAGVELSPVTDKLREKYSIPSRLEGIVVTDMDRASPFAGRLGVGSVIVEINDQSVARLSDLRKILTKGVNKFFIYDRGKTGYIAVRIN